MGKLPTTKAYSSITDKQHGKGFRAKVAVCAFADGLHVMIGAPTMRELKRAWGKIASVGMNEQAVQDVLVFREQLGPKLVKRREKDVNLNTIA